MSFIYGRARPIGAHLSAQREIALSAYNARLPAVTLSLPSDFDLGLQLSPVN